MHVMFCEMVCNQTAELCYLLPNSRCHCRLHYFSHMTCRSRTNSNECCVTGGTAVFSQIHRDGRAGWERHQRSTGRPLWVFMHFLYCLLLVVQLALIAFPINVLVWRNVHQKEKILSNSAMCWQWTPQTRMWNCSSQQLRRAERGPST